ncbi:MAG: radical SAM protein [Anaerolineae bacterium]
MRSKELVKLLVPPVLIPLLKKTRIAFAPLSVQHLERNAKITDRPCHYYELFVCHNGDVYPCCLTWGREKMKIGHLDDLDLSNKIRAFSSSCECGEYRLRRANSEDSMNYQWLNIELSLACQGKCVMCCVKAPDWKGSYNYYDSLTHLLEYCRPKGLLLQGGEVLIQKRSLDWVLSVRQRFGDDIHIALVSNGNVDVDMVDVVAQLFNRVTLSFVGFQTETYNTIMGMDVKRVKAFAEMLSKRRNVALYLKYLVTPINIHEAHVFFDWAVSLKPQQIQFAQASMASYIKKDTEDKYWDKICGRASEKLKAAWVRNKHILQSANTHVVFFEDTLKLYAIDDDFITRNGLEETYHLNLR